MARKKFKAEEIVMILRDIELSIGQDVDTVQACRKAGVSEQSYYRWRKTYGGMQIDQAKKYKDLERENNQLKRLVADLSLDNACIRNYKRETSKPGEEAPGNCCVGTNISYITKTGMSICWTSAFDAALSMCC